MLLLGKRIRELRMKKQLTQIDLAKGLCTPSMISQVESDKARPSYKMLFALSERLDAPLEKLLADVDMNLEHVSTYKMARAMLAGQHYASAIPLLKELLEMPRTQIPTMDILFELGECCLHTGEWDEAEKYLAEAQELALLRQDHQLLALVLKHLGEMEFQRKRFQIACHYWQKALEQAEKMEEPDVYLKAGLQQNLGKVNLQIGSVKDALDSYDRAAALYEGADNLHEMAHVYLGLAMSYKLSEDFEKAADYSERAVSIFESLKQIKMMIKNEIDSAVLYGQTGRLDEAEELLKKALGRLGSNGDKETQGIAYAELANVYLLQNELDQASKACEQARTLIPELSLYQAKINRTLGGIANKRGDVPEATRRYKMAADGFKRLKELREWDDTIGLLTEIYRGQGDFEKVANLLCEVKTFTRNCLSERGIEL
jgi:tetratricopeptide (TPR) repeat protein